MQEIQKPKSLRQIRKLKKRANTINESFKKTLLIRGTKVSPSCLSFMKDIRSLRKDKSVMYGRKHQIHPYENVQEIQKFCKSTDSSLFLFGSHNKKRPNSVTLGRTYQSKILDMVQLGITNYQSISQVCATSVPTDIHPFVVFQGDIWQTDESFKKMRNLLNDFFFINQKVPGVQIDKIMAVLVCFTVLENKKIVMRTYKVDIVGQDVLDQDGKILMDQLGPHAEFAVRRMQFADAEAWKKATYVPKPKKKKDEKNIKYDGVGNKKGKLYVDRQNLKNMPQKRKLIAKSPKNLKPKQQVLKQRVQNQFAQ